MSHKREAKQSMMEEGDNHSRGRKQDKAWEGRTYGESNSLLSSFSPGDRLFFATAMCTTPKYLEILLPVYWLIGLLMLFLILSQTQ